MPELNDKVVMAHACLFDANEDGEYVGDSAMACKISGNNDSVGIIEIDIRKSKDGVLYCYHGNLFEYYVLLHFFKKPMAFLRKKYKVNTLSAILDVIDDDKILFLDIKDTDVTRADILNEFDGRKFREVMLANKSPRFLKRFNNMPSCFVKRFNGNVFCDFYNPKKLKQDGFKYFEVVFPFQLNSWNVRRIREAGLELCTSGMFFLNRRAYWNKIKNYDVKYVISDHIEDNVEY